MYETLKIDIPGKIVSKQRPRVTKFGTYTPKKTVDYQTLIKQLWISKYPNQKPIQGPVSVCIFANFAIPSSISKKKKSLMLCGDLKPTKKPDVDNIAKSVCDALNNLAYLDDKQVVSIMIKKEWAERESLSVSINETL